MDAQFVHNVSMVLFCFLSGVLYLFSDNSLSYFGCNGIMLNNQKLTSIITNKQKDPTPYKNAHLTRILGLRDGPTFDHAVRIALVSDYKTTKCAGAIQNALYIITAAHCVSGVDPLQLVVTAGTGPVLEEFPKQNRSVVSFDIHPEWDSDTLLNDIALLKLNQSLFISSGRVSPRELGPPIPPGGDVTDVWITGWGLFNAGWKINRNRTYPRDRKSALVKLVDINTCKNIYQKQGKQIYKNQICAQAKNGSGPCTGDDGAPLIMGVLYPNFVWRVFVIGILLSFQECATGRIDIYTELGNYKNWIESIAGRQCDFNIHAYDNEKSTKISKQGQVFKPKGQIDKSVAYAICVSYNEFFRTNTIQGLLRSSTAFSNYDGSVQSGIKSSSCTNLQWNICRFCQKFVKVPCGRNINAITVPQVSLRIMGGHNAVPNQNPHQVRISRIVDDVVTNPTACGGIIYNSMYIIVAAACVAKDTPCWLIVTAGDHSVSTKEDTEQVRQAVSIMVHEHYDKQDSFKNNIALLKLNRPFNFTKYIHPVLLATKDYPTADVTSVVLSSWGFVNRNFEKPDILQSVEVPFINDCECRLAYATYRGNPINFDKICAGRPGQGICDGDLGTPWTVKDGETRYVIGITSFTGACGVAPGVATKLLTYREWIIMRAGVCWHTFPHTDNSMVSKILNDNYVFQGVYGHHRDSKYWLT